MKPNTLRQFRQAAGLTQAELASRAGVSLNTIKRYEAHEKDSHSRRRVLYLARIASRKLEERPPPDTEPPGAVILSKTRARLDLRNERYGRLTVIERAPTAPTGPPKWECRCDCGAMSTVRQTNLRSGKTQSCGCLRRESEGCTGNTSEPVTGKILPSPEAFDIYQARKAAGLTQKELAASAGISLSTLRNYEKGETGNIRLRRRTLEIAQDAAQQRASQPEPPKKARKMPNTRLDLSDQRYGRLTVIARAPTQSTELSKWECRCDCGASKIVLQANLRSGRTRSCGCLQKELAGRPKDSVRNLAGRDFVRGLIARSRANRAAREANPS